jgi:3'-5' exoribonuclease
MKLKELEVGKSCVIPLVVLSTTARETKAKKPYLALELYDGTDKISGNYWDWGGKAIPDKNTILNVSAQVTEWQGAKQLNINGLTTNTELHISAFMPASGLDIMEVYQDACILASEIKDELLKALCEGVLEDLKELWLTAPAANGIHHAYAAGTLIHSLSVAQIARAVAQTVPGANVDLATAGGLLHDIGKLFGYRINGIVCEMTDEGKLYDHLFMGAEFIGNHAENLKLLTDTTAEAKIEMLRHIILSHHGTQEHGAVVAPVSMEAHIVFHADAVDALAEMIRDASKKVTGVKWTDRIWALDNKPHLTSEYVHGVMHS